MELKITIEDNIQKIGKLLDELVIKLNTYGGDYKIETEIKLEHESQLTK